MSKTTAIVLGSGMSGMLAARVLSDHFDEVRLVDKRPLDATTRFFATPVPQADHLHVLLQRGQVVMERLFPGILADLAKAGGTLNDWGETTYWANPYGVHPQQPTEVRTLQFSRAALDGAVLARVMSRRNVVARSAKVTGFLGSRADARVRGVVAMVTGDDGVEASNELLADLVVDCRGRSSSIVGDLQALGYSEPPVSRVDNEMGYSSCFFDLPAEADWQLVYIQVRPGLINRGGAACQIDKNKLVVTLIGTGEDRPGQKPEEFLAFAESLAHPQIAEQLRAAKPVGEPRLWRSLGNLRRHFGRMSAWPRGLIVMGDALCAFNPVYGQGMTVAAVEAEALHETLGRAAHPVKTAWERPFQQRLEQLLFIPWFMSTMEDMRNRKFANPGPVARALHAYLDSVLRSAVHDHTLHVGFLRIMHMMRSPFSLLRPGTMLRVARRALQRAFGKTPPPQGLPASLTPLLVTHGD